MNLFNTWLLLLLRIRVPCKKREICRQFIFGESSIEGPVRLYPSRHETCFVDIVVQFLSSDQLFANQWTEACQSSLSFTISQSLFKFSSAFVQFSSITQSCPTLCDSMDCSMPGFPVHHELPELAQTHVHRVSDATQLSRSLSPPSPPVLFSFC